LPQCPEEAHWLVVVDADLVQERDLEAESLEFQGHEVLLLGFLVNQESETVSRPIEHSLSVELHVVIGFGGCFFEHVDELDCHCHVPVHVEFDRSMSK
jgi:hypothetical protein